MELRLARTGDGDSIAAMAREYIEAGLGWSWRSSRVQRCIRDSETTVLVADEGGRLAGFAIMWFGMEHARLNLLAVRPERRQQGLGRRLMGWLEASALEAGVSIVYLEVRARNHEAQGFYRRLGYRGVAILPGYYRQRESAVRMAHDLWERKAAAPGPLIPWQPPYWLDQ